MQFYLTSVFTIKAVSLPQSSGGGTDSPIIVTSKPSFTQGPIFQPQNPAWVTNKVVTMKSMFLIKFYTRLLSKKIVLRQ
jgi:hypothetical protein